MSSTCKSIAELNNQYKHFFNMPFTFLLLPFTTISIQNTTCKSIAELNNQYKQQPIWNYFEWKL